MLRLAAPGQGQDGAGLELVDAVVDRVRRRNVIVPHEARRGVAVDARRPAGMRAQRLELGAEQEQLAELGPVERLDAEPVAHQRQRALAAVPQRDREHADQPVQRRLDAERGESLPASPRCRNGRGTRRRARQRRPQFLVVVDLAVVDDDEAAVGRDHRLMAGRRQIDDRETAMRERDAGLGVDPNAVVVRPAMPQVSLIDAAISPIGAPRPANGLQ